MEGIGYKLSYLLFQTTVELLFTHLTLCTHLRLGCTDRPAPGGSGLKGGDDVTGELPRLRCQAPKGFLYLYPLYVYTYYTFGRG